MRAVLFLIFVTTLFHSCGECACKLGEANVAVVTSLYNDFATGNIDGVVGHMSPEIVWNEAENYIYADNNPYVGPDAILGGVFGRVGGEWNDFKVNDPKIMPVGTDHVLATGRYTGVYKSNGNALDAQFAHLWSVENGKVTSFQQYTDTKQAAEVIKVVDVVEVGKE